MRGAKRNPGFTRLPTESSARGAGNKTRFARKNFGGESLRALCLAKSNAEASSRSERPALRCGRRVDELSLACWPRYRLAELAKRFDMPLNSFTNIQFGLVQRASGRDTAWKVRHIRGPVRFGLFEDNCVLHAISRPQRLLPSALPSTFQHERRRQDGRG